MCHAPTGYGDKQDWKLNVDSFGDYSIHLALIVLYNKRPKASDWWVLELALFLQRLDFWNSMLHISVFIDLRLPNPAELLSSRSCSTFSSTDCC